MYPTLTIANYVILIGISRKRYVNADKLNKILYFLDACHLYETKGRWTSFVFTNDSLS